MHAAIMEGKQFYIFPRLLAVFAVDGANLEI